MTAREELLKEAKRLLALLPPEEAMKIIMDVLNEKETAK